MNIRSGTSQDCFKILSQLLVFGCMAALWACTTIQPATSLDDVATVTAAGHLPLVTAEIVDKLAATATVPVAVLVTTAHCDDCAEAVKFFARASADGEGKFIAVVLDAQANQAYVKAHSIAIYPSALIYRHGHKSWWVDGIEGIGEMAIVLLTNPPTYGTGFKFRKSTEATPQARVFLVAGMAEPAAFATEVVDQYVYWRSRGLKDEQIACFYSPPHIGQYLRAREHFDQLKPLLAKCFRAEIGEVERHWDEAVATKPTWLYLYVTSHGSPGSRVVDEDGRPVVAQHTPCDVFSSPFLVFDAQPGHAWPQTLAQQVYTACYRQQPLAVFNRYRLFDLLAKTPPQAQKTVVLQGCFAGGVMPGALTPNTTILAAARRDRSSFGCAVDAATTNYGAKYLEALTQLHPDPSRPEDWLTLHRQLVPAIAAMESAAGIKSGNRSEPQIVVSPAATGERP